MDIFIEFSFWDINWGIQHQFFGHLFKNGDQVSDITKKRNALPTHHTNAAILCYIFYF